MATGWESWKKTSTWIGNGMLRIAKGFRANREFRACLDRSGLLAPLGRKALLVLPELLALKAYEEKWVLPGLKVRLALQARLVLKVCKE